MNDRELIYRILDEIKANKKSRFALTGKYIQHGNTTVMAHVIEVAVMSCRIAEALRIKVNKRALIRGALLHDYFLYDWHEKRRGHNIHGFTHPYKALANADEDFILNDIERNVILRHMFPLTPVPPMCREAWIVCMADKYCSTRETMYTIARCGKLMKRTLWG